MTIKKITLLWMENTNYENIDFSSYAEFNRFIQNIKPPAQGYYKTKFQITINENSDSPYYTGRLDYTEQIRNRFLILESWIFSFFNYLLKNNEITQQVFNTSLKKLDLSIHPNVYPR